MLEPCLRMPAKTNSRPKNGRISPLSQGKESGEKVLEYIYIYIVLCLSSFSEIQQNVRKDNSGHRRRGGGVLGGESMGSEQAGYCTRTFSYIVLIILKKQLKQISKHSKILPKLGILRPILGIEIQLVFFFHYIRLRFTFVTNPATTSSPTPLYPNKRMPSD